MVRVYCEQALKKNSLQDRRSCATGSIDSPRSRIPDEMLGYKIRALCARAFLDERQRTCCVDVDCMSLQQVGESAGAEEPCFGVGRRTPLTLHLRNRDEPAAGRVALHP